VSANGTKQASPDVTNLSDETHHFGSFLPLLFARPLHCCCPCSIHDDDDTLLELFQVSFGSLDELVVAWRTSDSDGDSDGDGDGAEVKELASLA